MHSHSFVLTVLSLYVGTKANHVSEAVPELHLHPEQGIVGDRHAGKARVRSNGEVVPNWRQFTALSPAELGVIAEQLGVPYIDPRWLSANICFSSPLLTDFTKTLSVPGTLLLDQSGQAVMEVKGDVEPCVDAGAEVASRFPEFSIQGHLFPKYAHKRRGILGIVLAETTLHVGDTLTAVLPEG